MDENEFWALIDRSREGDDAQEEALEALLTGRSREELEPAGPAHEGDPEGEEWDEDEVYDRYPRLAEKFG